MYLPTGMMIVILIILCYVPAVVLECNVFVSPIVSSSNVHIFFSQFEMAFVFVASL